MAEYVDAKHRPHAVHTGEVPDNIITYGPASIEVTLDRWGPIDNLFTSMYDALQANWGEFPSRTVHRNPAFYAADDRVNGDFALRTGWTCLKDEERDYIEMCFSGKTLQQVLEGVTFDFCINGVTRAFTHQNVRTRLGAGFMQHGGRDNDWRHRAWTMPETMSRMCEMNEATGIGMDKAETMHAMGLKDCITDWAPIHAYLDNVYAPSVDEPTTEHGIREAITDHIMRCRMLYAALVDAGIPWQDARRVLPIGMQTYIHDQYNYLALQGMLANRLEHIMDWEHNCVAQLMLREIKMKCPPLISKYLGSHSDKARAAKFAGLESWPPDRKYPSPYDVCKTCNHPGHVHIVIEGTPRGERQCAQCEREYREIRHKRTHSDPPIPSPLHRYVPKDSLERQHRPEQNPFWVLHPDSMAGGPIVWIPTNGEYPHDAIEAARV